MAARCGLAPPCASCSAAGVGIAGHNVRSACKVPRAKAARGSWRLTPPPSTPTRSGNLAPQSAGACRAGEQVDPVTGRTIAAEDVVLKKSCKAGRFEWAYREVEPKGGDADAPLIVLIHGILCSSYSYRQVMDNVSMLAPECRVVAPDWIGHGNSQVPSTVEFSFKADDYIKELEVFLGVVNPSGKPFTLVTQGFIHGQYALLFALRNPDLVEKLFMLNTPLRTGLNPYLKKFAPASGLGGALAMFAPKPPKDGAEADYYVAAGGPYMLERAPAEALRVALARPGAQEAFTAAMDNCEYDKLLRDVDEGFCTWRQDSLVAFGTSDYYVDWKSAIEWLDDKRTCMKMFTFPDKMGHFPQEDFPERVAEVILQFMRGEDLVRTDGLKRMGDSTQ